MLETPALGTETTRKGLKLLLSIGDPSTPLSTQVDTDVMDQAFLFHFCILQAIKNWTVGRPGNEASAFTNVAVPGRNGRHSPMWQSRVEMEHNSIVHLDLNGLT